MKINAFILILLVTGLFSCSEDFLQKELLNEINSSVYYTSEEDATGAIIAVYDVLGWYGGVWGSWIYRINYSGVDLSHPGGNGGFGEWTDALFDYRHTSGAERFLRETYQQHYTCIMRANHVLKFVGQADINEDHKNTVLAEARFLRALAYYNLIRLYGDVPLITDVQSYEQFYSEREKSETVYDFILDDLESNNVVEQLPESWGGVNIGRSTTGAARMLLAHIYLTRAGHRIDSESGASKEIDGASSENWQKAHDYAQSIIDLNIYKLWTDEDVASGSYISYIPERVENKDKVKTGYEINFWTENDPESVFEVQFVSWWPGRWADGNVRQEGSNNNAFDWNLASGVEEHGYSNNFPLPGFVNSYEAGDKRKAATVLGPGDTIWLKQYTEDMNPFYVHDGYLSPAAEREGFEGVWLSRKWLYGRTDERESSPRNIPVWRYAEVYLILAETLNEMGQTNEAYEYINVIRNRAGLANLQTGLTVEEFREAVYEERKFELAYEGNRWFDAIRSKKLIDWVKADRNAPVTQKHYLLPLDQAAIETNPSLYQNWGY